ncbi:MAG: DUF4097 domain-containing protein [Firmicutes bacterium]|nr:DUF4097 domain-containing protein [Bacillota bacterium]
MKVFNWIFIGFIIVGAIGGIVALSIYRFDFSSVWADMTNIPGYTQTERRFGLDDVKDKITINLRNESLVVRTADTQEVVISYWVRSDSDSSYDIEDYELAFTMERDWRVRNWFGGLRFGTPVQHRVYITLPQDFDTVLHLNNRNGSMRIYGQNLELQEFRATNHNGSIRLSGLTAEEQIYTRSNNGSIRISNATVTGSEGLIEARSNNGSIRIINSEAYSVITRTNNGSTRIERGAFKNVHATTSNGSNRIEIVGNQADFTITMTTRNGSNRLNGNRISSGTRGEGPNPIHIQSSNGSNRLSFR